MGRSRSSAPGRRPGREAQRSSAAATNVGQLRSKVPASSPATSMSSWRARWSTSKSISPTLRTSREVIGIWSTSKSSSSISAYAGRRSVAKAAGFPDQVAQVDDQLRAVDQVGLVQRQRAGQLLGLGEQLQRRAFLEGSRRRAARSRRAAGRWPGSARGRRPARGRGAGSRGRPRSASLHTWAAAWCSSWAIEPSRSQVPSALRVSTGVPSQSEVGLAHEPTSRPRPAAPSGGLWITRGLSAPGHKLVSFAYVVRRSPDDHREQTQEIRTSAE